MGIAPCLNHGRIALTAASSRFEVDNTAQALREALDREAATAEILQVISRSRSDYGPVFDVILDKAIELCQAPFACLFLVDENKEGIVIAAHRGACTGFVEAINNDPLSLDPNLSATAQCLHEKRAIQVEDMAAGKLYHDREPHRVYAVEVEGIRTFLVVPLISGGAGIGAIALYRHDVRPFQDSLIDLVKTFAQQSVIAIENVQQFRELEARTNQVRAQAEELKRWNKELETRVSSQVEDLERLGRLRRFLPPSVVETIVSKANESLLSSHRAFIAVLFCDLRDFTAFCESAEPEETIEVLQTYHEALGKLILKHDAGVDHRSGDGIMVIFNDPLPCEEPAREALRLALAMRDRMKVLCSGWRRLGHRLGFGVGISLGYATVGMVGFEGRYEYTASGTAVNLAARLCDHAQNGEILLSPRAAAAVEEQVHTETAGELTLKGFHAPVEVFRVGSFKTDRKAS